MHRTGATIAGSSGIPCPVDTVVITSLQRADAVGLASSAESEGFDMSVLTEGLVPPAGGAICDFCSSPEVFQVYMAEDFTAVELVAPDGNPVYLNSTGGWAACCQCAKLVEDEKWGELRERCFRTFKAGLPAFPCLTIEDEREIKGILRGAHEQFRRLRKRAA